MTNYVLKGRIFDATGITSYENGAIIIKDDKIVAVGSQNDIVIPEGYEVREYGNNTILPGLIDAHVHLGLGTSNVSTMFSKTPEDKVCLFLREVEKIVDAGFTTVRECGGFANKMKDPLIQHGFKSPKISASGRFISQTSGHGDLYQAFPLEMLERTKFSTTADGVEGCLKAARLEFREGADFIKIATTGGFMSKGAKLSSSQYTDAEIRAFVEVAEQNGSYVACHAHGVDGIKLALRNGVKCIEHGTFLDDETIKLLIENEAAVIPTLLLAEISLTNFDKLPPWVQEKSNGLGDPSRGMNFLEVFGERHQKAYKAGVKYGLGTDLLGDVSGAHGINGREFEVYVKYLKLSPAEAIIAGTRTNSEILGWNDQVGTLEVGKQADVIVVQGNPLEDITLLSNPDNIKLVMIDGKIEKELLG